MKTKVALVVAPAVLLAAFAGVRTNAQQGRTRPLSAKMSRPILYKHCVTCHRPGEIGPMSLLTYEQARPYAKAIANAVTNRTMPPWHAEAPAGTFHNERSLSDLERQTLTAWAAGGAINGDPKDLPAQPTFSDGWSLGTPDVVLEMLEDYRIPAKGTIQYEWFYIPTNFAEPKWVKSIEIRPGHRGAVHHVLVYYRAKPDAKTPPVARGNAKDQSDPPPDEPGVAERPRRICPVCRQGSSQPTRRVRIRRSRRREPPFASNPAGCSSCRCITPRQDSLCQTGRESGSPSRPNRHRARCEHSTS